MQCPTCQSSDVSSCAVAHAKGTGYGTNVRTAFAAKASPPDSGIGNAVVLAGFATLIHLFLRGFYIYAVRGAMPGWLSMLLIVLQVWGIWLVVSAIGGLPKHRAATEQWRRTWICGQCGHKFVPDAAAAA